MNPTIKIRRNILLECGGTIVSRFKDFYSILLRYTIEVHNSK